MTLYEVLGISRDATDAEIRAAYLRASKKTHPDAGGSDEEFERVKLAYDILKDPDRRRAYDETGVERPVHADNSGAQALETLGHAFNRVLQNIRNQQLRPQNNDLAAIVRFELEQEINGALGQRNLVLMELHEAEDLIARFSGGPLKAILNNKANGIRRRVQEVEARVDIIRRARALMDDVTFRTDPLNG